MPPIGKSSWRAFLFYRPSCHHLTLNTLSMKDHISSFKFSLRITHITSKLPNHFSTAASAGNNGKFAFL